MFGFGFRAFGVRTLVQAVAVTSLFEGLRGLGLELRLKFM